MFSGMTRNFIRSDQRFSLCHRYFVENSTLKPFVRYDSIVRRIWGRADTILFIFGGAAAEFALNKAVDWLYYTGRLPADPIGRLFSTVTYARHIVFSPTEKANAIIDNMRGIHQTLEANRGQSIPDWAYRDVLFMLVHYSIAAHEVLYHRLSHQDRADVFDVFRRVGARMQIKDLPETYEEWLPVYQSHLENDLEVTHYTHDLFAQYKKHLGPLRFRILREAQHLVVPERVRSLLPSGSAPLLKTLLPFYKMSRHLNLDWWLTSILLPKEYKDKVKGLNRQSSIVNRES
jgi:hypothetical protein